MCCASRECEQYARHMTKPDPRDGSTLNFNSPEEQEAVEVVFQNAITPLAEVGKFTALPHGISSYHLQLNGHHAGPSRLEGNSYRLCQQLTGCLIFRCAVGRQGSASCEVHAPAAEAKHRGCTFWECCSGSTSSAAFLREAAAL